MADKKVRVVYEGPEDHVHVEDRAFDRRRPVEVTAAEARRFAAALPKGHLKLVKE